jgi:membrane-associated PAP2 superfamily phosphatase
LLDADASGRIVAILCWSALFIYWLGTCTDIDLRLADAMFDRASGVFPWRHAWLAETFNHRILKIALTLAGLGFIAAAFADAGRRAGLRVVAMSAVLVPLSTSMLKQNSVAHCPWNLARYGGAEPYARLFELLPPGAMPGHCLPAGHASSALWLVSVAVLWLPGEPRKALLAALLALGGGFAVGWMQQLRGAHFLTHTLWSMWIACAIVFALVQLVQHERG